MSFQMQSLTQQLASHLRAEIQRGRWTDTMPGTPYLAAELGVNERTVNGAFLMLEREGLLAAQGAGRNRRIVPVGGAAAGRPLRVGLFLWATRDRFLSHILDLQHRLTEAGHVIVHPNKSLIDLNMDAGRVARVASQTNPDAWIVASASAEVLEWFARQKKPALALFGNMRGVPIAAVGLNNGPAIAECTRSLLELGHRRIVLLVRRQHRKPRLGLVAQAFQKTMAAYGISLDGYLLPDWEETVEGFQKCLTSLFQLTPPTAIITDQPEHFTATYHFIAGRGLRVPQDVSLIYHNEGQEEVFDWCVPSVTHIKMDLGRVVRHAVRWMDKVSQGKSDRRQTLIITKYVLGGTVAPPRDATR